MSSPVATKGRAEYRPRMLAANTLRGTFPTAGRMTHRGAASALALAGVGPVGALTRGEASRD